MTSALDVLGQRDHPWHNPPLLSIRRLGLDLAFKDYGQLPPSFVTFT